MLTDEPAYMWPFEREAYVSMATALEHAFPKTLKANPMLTHCVGQIRAAEAVINKIMTDAAAKEV